MSNPNKPSKYTNKSDKLINANYYWNDDQLRVMRGLNMPIWYTPVLKTVVTPIVSEYNKKTELTLDDIKITNEKKYLSKQNILEEYKILNLNNSVITDYIHFNEIINNIINNSNDSISNYLFITESIDKNDIDIKRNNESNKFFIDNIDYSLLYNIANSLKWILNKQDNNNNQQGNKQEDNYFLMPIQFNLNKIITTLKPKLICVMGHSLIHYFENDTHFLLKKIIENDIKYHIKDNIKDNMKDIIKDNKNIENKLNIYHYNDTPLIFINSIDEVRNNLILKSDIWFMLNVFLKHVCKL